MGGDDFEKLLTYYLKEDFENWAKNVKPDDINVAGFIGK